MTRQAFTIGIVVTATGGVAMLVAGAADSNLGLVASGLLLLGVVAYGWMNRLDKLQP